MTASDFHLLVTVYLSIVFHRGHGSEVIQTRSRAVNPDGATSITCAYAAEVKSVEDVRLYRRLPTDTQATLICQKGSSECHLKNVLISQRTADPREWLFILMVEPRHANATYECEFTVNNSNDLHVTERGHRTRPLPGQKETTDCEPPTSSPPAPQFDQLSWILIGLLALLFLCICVILCFCIRLKKSRREHENSTYVEMRKAPLPRNPDVGVYCGN